MVCARSPNTCKSISIHALLAESDAHLTPLTAVWSNFYPRSPCGERRIERFCILWQRVFLSTLSLRRATIDTQAVVFAGVVISIHALLAESDVRYDLFALYALISIHALLAESDASIGVEIDEDKLFLSTLSLRRAT